MTTFSHHRIATLAGPTSLLLIPKCPLCLLPLLAAVGVGAPANLTLVINVVVGIVAVVWLWFVFSAAPSPILRASSLVLTVLLVSGRTLDFVPAATTYAVVLLMFLLAVVTTRRCGCAKRTS